MVNSQYLSRSHSNPASRGGFLKKSLFTFYFVRHFLQKFQSFNFLHFLNENDQRVIESNPVSN